MVEIGTDSEGKEVKLTRLGDILDRTGEKKEKSRITPMFLT